MGKIFTSEIKQMDRLDLSVFPHYRGILNITKAYLSRYSTSQNDNSLAPWSVTYGILRLYSTSAFDLLSVSASVTYVILILYSTDSNTGLTSQFQVEI